MTTDTPTAREAVMGDNAKEMGIIVMLTEDPKMIFRDPKVLPALLKHYDEEIEKAPKDASERAAQDKLRTDAANIGRLKAMLDRAGLGLTEDYRKQTKAVNEIRNEIDAELKTRQEKLRAPLTEWEDREKVRAEKVRAYREYLEQCLRPPPGASVNQVEKARERIMATEITEALFGDLMDKVTEERTAALQALDAAKAVAEQKAKDDAELQQLRQEKADRDAREEEARKVAAAEEEKRIEREAAEREKREAVERAAQEARDAAQREALEREAEAQRARDAAAAEERRVAQEKLDEANRKADEAEAARIKAEQEAQAQRDALLRQQREVEAERQREAAAAEARRADQEHRDRVFAEIADDIVKHSSVPAAAARKIVLALVAGSVRHVEVKL